MMIQTYRGYHSGWIQTVHMQRGGSRELISGSIAGEVNFWDTRVSEPLGTVQAHQGDMLSLAMHDQAPVFATGSAHQVVKVWNIAGDEPISAFRNSATYGSRHGSQLQHLPMSSLAFHPHHMVLAAGAEDNHINVYRCDVAIRHNSVH